MPTPAHLGALQRCARALTLSPDDAFAYAGTTSGDVLQVGLERALLRATGPAKAPLQQGVTASAAAPGGGALIVGSGDGQIAVLALSDGAAPGGAPPQQQRQQQHASSSGRGKSAAGGGGSTSASCSGGDGPQPKPLSVLAMARVEGGVSSIAVEGGGAGGGGWAAFVGTKASNVYRVTYDAAARRLAAELLQTAHPGRVNALAFPAGCGDVFTTAAAGGVRVWHAAARRELLRIVAPNLECRCLAFAAVRRAGGGGYRGGRQGRKDPEGEWGGFATALFFFRIAAARLTTPASLQNGPYPPPLPRRQDGKSIITGWSDGRVRVFAPQSGRLLYCIDDAHRKAVTAVATTADPSVIVTGGEEGARCVAGPPCAAPPLHAPPFNALLPAPPLPPPQAPSQPDSAAKKTLTPTPSKNKAWCASGASARAPPRSRRLSRTTRAPSTRSRCAAAAAAAAPATATAPRRSARRRTARASCGTSRRAGEGGALRVDWWL